MCIVWETGWFGRFMWLVSKFLWDKWYYSIILFLLHIICCIWYAIQFEFTFRPYSSCVLKIRYQKFDLIISWNILWNQPGSSSTKKWPFFITILILCTLKCMYVPFRFVWSWLFAFSSLSLPLSPMIKMCIFYLTLRRCCDGMRRSNLKIFTSD